VTFKPPDDLPVFDPAAFAALLGKRMLIGITYLRADETVESQEQMFGTVTLPDLNGIEIALEGKRQGKVFKLPPDLRAIEPAKPGVYTLRSTKETVLDPDYLATWTVKSPPIKQ